MDDFEAKTIPLTKNTSFFRKFVWLMEFLCSICKGELVDQGFRGSEVLIAGDEYLKGILKSTWTC